MKIKDKLVNGIRLGDVKPEPVKKIAEISAAVNAEGTVLLKNNGMLPFRKGDSVAVFGRLMRAYYKSGTGSGGMVNTEYVTNIFDSLKKLNHVVLNEEIEKFYDKWIKQNPFDAGDGWVQPWSQKEAVLDDKIVEKAAKESEKAIMIIGRTAGESKDNTPDKGSYALSDEEYTMIEKLTKYFKNVCVVLNVGNIIDMAWAEELNVDAVMYVWHGGQEGGAAAADVLCGKRYPSGKLTDTIAYSIEDYPSYKGFENVDEVVYTDDIFVGYRYFETFAKERVMYPFGFGLSYTNFEYTVKPQVIGDKFTAEVTVKNVGDRTGKEVIQAYYEMCGGKLAHPSRELVAFAKTAELNPQESDTVKIEFKISDMASYDDDGTTGNKSCFVLEKGEYNIYIGTDVRSAAKEYTYLQEETAITERLNTLPAPSVSFKRLTNKNGKAEYEEVKEQKRAAHTIETNAPKFTGDKGIKLKDVFDKKYTAEEFASQLTDFELACLSQGEGMNSAKVRPGTGGAIGGVTYELQNYGIPVVCVTDGPSGLRFDNGDAASSLPIGTLIACTWNEELAEQLYTYEGMEIYAYKVDALLGPGINIHRLPLCGRNFEYLSEDPYLTGVIANGMCRGLKNAGISATIKHFAVNNKEFNRVKVNTVVSERALREIYLKAFEMIVKDNNTKMLMTAYNQLNGAFCSANYELNTTVLRDEWHYDGLVMSDWWAKTCFKDGDAAADRYLQIDAQNDVYMVNADSEKVAAEIMQALSDGKTSRSELLRNAVNILNVIMTTPTFERFIDGEDMVNEAADIEKMSLSESFCDVKPNKEYNVNTDEGKMYAVRAEVSSQQQELVQIPIKVYVNGNSAALIMAQGTGGEKKTFIADFYMMKGENKVSFDFTEESATVSKIDLFSE